MTIKKHLLVALPLIWLSSMRAEPADLPYGHDSADDEHHLHQIFRTTYSQPTSRTIPAPSIEKPIPTTQTPTPAQQNNDATDAQLDAAARNRYEYFKNALKEIETQENIDALKETRRNNALIASTEIGLAVAVGILWLTDKMFHEGLLGTIEAGIGITALACDFTRRYTIKNTINADIAEQEETLKKLQRAQH